MPSLTCPTCGASLEPHARLRASMVCAKCYAVVSVAGSVGKRLGTQVADAAARLTRNCPLLIGAHGKLRGRSVVVSGLLERADGPYFWYECAVADENSDINWIWADRGHFSLCVCEGEDCVKKDNADYLYQNHALECFNRGRARILAAAGEFPYELALSDEATITDYIAPPFVASLESGEWWIFEYVPVEEIEAAFGVSCDAPEDIGVNQPSPYLARRKAFAFVTAAALALLALVQVLVGRHANDTPLIAGRVDLSDPKSWQSFGPFTLQRRWTSLDVRLSAPVENAWADVTLALVDQATGRSYWTSRGVEFYRGVDADGPWTDGSTEASALVRSIPTGTYTLIANAETGTWSTGAAPTYAEIEVLERPAPVSNLMFALAVVLGIAALYVWLGRRFEARRWENSDLGSAET